MRLCAQFLGVSTQYLTKFAKGNGDLPAGEYVGRERVFDINDMIRIRALLAATAKKPYDYLAWRKPGDSLPAIYFASLKIDSANSVTAAQFAQYLNLHYGMRVGLMDAHPQCAATLCFSGSGGLPLVTKQGAATMLDLAGLYAGEDGRSYAHHDAVTLNRFFQKTSWPGIRLVPAQGRTSEGEQQISRLIKEPEGKAYYRYLRDSIERWRNAHEPRTAPDVLVCQGRILEERLDEALNETLDCFVIDCQPALSLFQLNNVVASMSLVIPLATKRIDIVMRGYVEMWLRERCKDEKQKEFRMN